MLKQKIEQAINKQINAELWSAYLYLSMSTYFESISLGGFANWMRIQAQEEVAHAMRFYDYVVERGGRVKLMPIDSVKTDWKSPLDAFEETYKHEQKVTGLINDLVNTSTAEKDHATVNMLQWFVDEQVEEESSADEIVQKLKLIGKDGSGLFMIDRELAQRVFTPPVKSKE
ncbi:MAG: ferritin [Candidatus Thermoplasmatota archaeon]|nr:ferritin [Candidatus Thermoplasmatota archaeon]